MSGFSYTPDALRELVKEWTDLAIDYRDSVRAARRMASVEGPGREFASQSHASMASYCGKRYLDSLEAKNNHCWEQADKCQRALDDYLGVEHRNVREIYDAAPQAGI